MTVRVVEIKTTVFIFMIIFCLSSVLRGANKQTDAREVLIQSAKKLKENNFFRYKASYRAKGFDDKDTSEVLEYQCTVFKVPQDTVLGYYARIWNDSEERIYDGRRFLLIWNAEKRVVSDDPGVTGRRFTASNISQKHIPGVFFSEHPFQYWLNSEVKLQLRDSTLENGRQCFLVEATMPPEDEITLLNRSVLIDKRTYLPLMFTGFARYMDIQDEFWELSLENLSVMFAGRVEFDNFYKYPSGYREERFQPPTTRPLLLPVGSTFIPFGGRNTEGSKLSIGWKRDRRLILLDFWYLACAPCLRAIPELAKLSSEFHARGLDVIGVNSFDDPIQRQSEIRAFTNRLGINYPLLFVDKQVDAQYKVSSYPTLYLFKEDSLVYAQYGYQPKELGELARIIDKELESTME